MGKIISLALAFTSLLGGLVFFWNAGRVARFDYLIGMAVLAGTHFVFALVLLVSLTMKLSRRSGKRPLPMRTWLLIMLIGLLCGDSLLVWSARINREKDQETQRRGETILEKSQAFFVRERKFPQSLTELGAGILPPAIEDSRFEISGSNDQDFLVSYISVSSVTCSKRLGANAQWHCDE